MFLVESEGQFSRVESEGRFSTCVSGWPIVFRDKKVFHKDKEIMMYEDINFTQVHHSPDGLKVLISSKKANL